MDSTSSPANAHATACHVPSPCVSVCTMNATSGLCEGCLRTLDEIAAWSGMHDENKRQVWSLIKQRANGALP